MTECEMREYLEGHFYASKKIKALEAEKLQLRLKAQGGAINYEENNTVSKLNHTERKLMEIADDENEIDCEIQKLKNKQKEIRRTISLLHDNDLESVLIFRYIVYRSEEETAEELHYANRTVQEKIKKAIKKLCGKMC